MFIFARFDTWSLKTKFALCSGVLMLVFTLAFASWTLHTVEADLHSSVLDAQRALVRSTAQDLADKIDLRRDAMMTIAPLLSRAAPAPGAAMDAFFAPRPVLQKMFDVVVITDATGRIVHDLPHGAGIATIGASVASRDYFATVAAGKELLVISSPERSASGGEPYIVFAAPLRSPDGQVRGALIGVLQLTRPNFLGNLGKVRIGQQGYFALVERTANPVFIMHGEANRIMSPAPGGLAHPILVQATQSREGTLEGVSAFGMARLSTFIALRAVPWVLVAVYPTSEAFAGLDARRREVLWVGSALFAVAAAVAWLMSGWLLRPLARLRTLMDQHAAEPGLRATPADFGSEELATLAFAYNAQSDRRHLFEERLKSSQQRMKAVTDNVPVRIAYVDTEERYTFVNAHVGRSFERDPAAMLGKTLREVCGAAEYAQIAPQVALALSGRSVSFEGAGLDPAEPYYYHANFLPDHDSSGRVLGFYLMAYDITALKEAQARQARVEDRLRAITDNLPVLISYVDRDERYGFVNDTFRSWLGIDPAAATGRRMCDVTGPDIHATHAEEIRRCLAGERVSFETEVDTLLGRKSLQSVYVPDVRSDRSVAGFYTLSSDVTALKDAQDRLSLLVRSDALTGLPNRFQFNESLPIALSRCARAQTALALLFLDVDKFKQINDTYGHSAGDAVLEEFARRLLRSVRLTDQVARLAGDEFVVILEGLNGEIDAQVVADRILDEMTHAFEIEGRRLQVTTSVGIAFHERGAVSAAELLARADAALYQAKAAGRNTYRMATA